MIEAVVAEGKFLMIRFDDGSELETHLKMNGSWHLYRPGERWRRSRRQAVAVVSVADWVAVCFAAPHVVLVGPGRRSPGRRARGAGGLDRSALGPDLCTPDPDLDEVVARVDRYWLPGTPILDVLLDQRVFCGVGNVFKSEVLHACLVHPLTPIGALDDAARRRLAATANTQLLANVEGGPRRTVPQGLAVYGRRGQPCHRCHDRVAADQLGTPPRITAWCPTCQPKAVPRAGRSESPPPEPD